MARLILNGTFEVEGDMSFNVGYDAKANPPVLEIVGELCIAEYVDDIISIESERYMVDDVVVFNEGYGTDDNKIVYSFMAGNYKVFDIEAEDNEEDKDEEV